MKRFYSVAIVTTLAFTPLAHAQNMLAKVVQDSDGIVSQVYQEVPVKSCRIEQIPIYGTQAGGNQASTADVVASAIFGGLLGNQVGGGSGKDAATLIGAIAGADLANKKGQSKQVVVGQKQQEVCDVIMQQRSVEKITGYSTYIEFGGNIWIMKTTIPYKNGEFLSVNVDIKPAE
jgi:uncharacterized protein YcfJ